MIHKWEGHEFDEKDITVSKITAWMCLFRCNKSEWHVPIDEISTDFKEFLDKAPRKAKGRSKANKVQSYEGQMT